MSPVHPADLPRLFALVADIEGAEAGTRRTRSLCRPPTELRRSVKCFAESTNSAST